MSAKTVWLIEQGKHSDYSVVGVYSDREKADRVCQAINEAQDDNHADATVAERPLDPAIDEMDAGRGLFYVCLEYDGTTASCRAEGISYYELTYALHVYKRTEIKVLGGRPITDIVMGTVWAKDKAHAVEIANEYRTRMIATDQMHKRS